MVGWAFRPKTKIPRPSPSVFGTEAGPDERARGRLAAMSQFTNGPDAPTDVRARVGCLPHLLAEAARFLPASAGDARVSRALLCGEPDASGDLGRARYRPPGRRVLSGNGTRRADFASTSPAAPRSLRRSAKLVPARSALSCHPPEERLRRRCRACLERARSEGHFRPSLECHRRGGGVVAIVGMERVVAAASRGGRSLPM